MDISYIQQDYLKLEEENRYDLILLIFTDFGVLTPDQRDTLLGNICRALKPGGTFVFDVLNENSEVQESASKNWELVEKGFWRNHPYLALTESFYYEKQKVTLSQHIIMMRTAEPKFIDSGYIRFLIPILVRLSRRLISVLLNATIILSPILKCVVPSQ